MLIAGIALSTETSSAARILHPEEVLQWSPSGYLSNFMCKCGCRGFEMDEDFMDRFQLMRVEFIKEKNIDIINHISSGYRCKNHPIESKKKNNGMGPHTRGKAVDIKIYGNNANALFYIAKKYMTGIGMAQRGRNKRSRYIHIDSLNPKEARRPTIWQYK